jgi:diadenosine tetraphosphate (Ap4A) HIT family hydrolase
MLSGAFSDAVSGLNPIVLGHTLVVPKRTVRLLSELSPVETDDLFDTVTSVQMLIARTYPDVTAFNLSIKDGPSAGQVVPVLHIHVVPRRPFDLPSPDVVYELLERWTPVPGAVDPPFPPPLGLAPEELRVERTREDMAKEAAVYAAKARELFGGRPPSRRFRTASGEEGGGEGGAVWFSRFELDPRQVFFESASGSSLAIVNLKPLVPGHVLVISRRRSAARCLDLTRAEVRDLWDTVRKVQAVLLACYSGADACHIGVQDGPDSGQTVPHVHVHILPVLPATEPVDFGFPKACL